VEVSRYVADYRGRRYPEQFSGDGWVAVTATPDERAAGLLPDEIEHGEGRQGPWVRLPLSVLDRRVRIVVEARWRGESVGVSGPELEGTVLVRFQGDPDRARELGMQGDQRDGWQLRVPVEEVGDVDVTEREY
jgi:hypothetical protein